MRRSEKLPPLSDHISTSVKPPPLSDHISTSVTCQNSREHPFPISAGGGETTVRIYADPSACLTF